MLEMDTGKPIYRYVPVSLTQKFFLVLRLFVGSRGRHLSDNLQKQTVASQTHMELPTGNYI